MVVIVGPTMMVFRAMLITRSRSFMNATRDIDTAIPTVQQSLHALDWYGVKTARNISEILSPWDHCSFLVTILVTKFLYVKYRMVSNIAISRCSTETRDILQS